MPNGDTSRSVSLRECSIISSEPAQKPPFGHRVLASKPTIMSPLGSVDVLMLREADNVKGLDLVEDLVEFIARFQFDLRELWVLTIQDPFPTW